MRSSSDSRNPRLLTCFRSAAYSLSGQVAVTLVPSSSWFCDAPPVDERFFLESLVLTFEGQSELVTSQTGHASCRLIEFSEELITNGPIEIHHNWDEGTSRVHRLQPQDPRLAPTDLLHQLRRPDTGRARGQLPPFCGGEVPRRKAQPAALVAYMLRLHGPADDSGRKDFRSLSENQPVQAPTTTLLARRVRLPQLSFPER